MTRTTLSRSSSLLAGALAVVIGLAMYVQGRPSVAAAAPAHGWEYLRIIRERSVQSTVLGGNAIIGDWATTFIGQKEAKTEANIDQLINEFGAQGWELVTIYTTSGDAGIPLNASGMTMLQAWVFKRPK